MKIIKLAFTLTLLGATAVSAAEGSMSCKVKSNSVTSVKEGKPEFYTGYKEQFEVGETLTLTYSSQGSSGVYIGLEDVKRDTIVINSYFSDVEVTSKDALFLGKGLFSGMLHQDTIFIDQGFRRLTLFRY